MASTIPPEVVLSRQFQIDRDYLRVSWLLCAAPLSDGGLRVAFSSSASDGNLACFHGPMFRKQRMYSLICKISLAISTSRPNVYSNFNFNSHDEITTLEAIYPWSMFVLHYTLTFSNQMELQLSFGISWRLRMLRWGLTTMDKEPFLGSPEVLKRDQKVLLAVVCIFQDETSNMTLRASWKHHFNVCFPKWGIRSCLTRPSSSA